MDYNCIILLEAEASLAQWPQKHRDKINDFLRLLEERNGILDEPYSRHLNKKIRELRVNFGKSKYRVLYALIPNKKILVILAFKKNTSKTPKYTIEKAETILKLYLSQ
ncbi:MAG: type II toxin-antitoxin system RelE/ParE family toxin [bacterium]|nr:type II toxin-antitoxin system RelE/ParE family toxin [bacterium]